MSIGNTKDNSNKGNNFPWQHAVLELLGTISTNTGGAAGQDYELVTTTYKANKNGVGYSNGDTITRTQIYLMPVGTLSGTIWFNQSTGLTIAAPPIADIDVVMPATAVTVNNLPVVLGQALMANSLAVTIASNQSALAVTNPNLDAPLSALNLEATQLLIKALLTTIDGDTSNLDVLLSTRLAEATFTARINTLGQKAMAASTPVVLASDQSTIPVSVGKNATATLTSVASSIVSGTILAANAGRNGATIANNGTRILYLKFGGGVASSTSFTVRLTANSYYEVPFGFTGVITGVWNVANGSALVTEITT